MPKVSNLKDCIITPLTKTNQVLNERLNTALEEAVVQLLAQ